MSKEYIEVTFHFDNQEQLDMLVAYLAVLGFDGFNEEGNTCKTFIEATEYAAQEMDKELNEIFKQYNLTYSKSIIKEKNWNAIWEANFDPVRVGDFVGIRAHFHPSFNPSVEHEIHITPKMSFGTGHHATTFTVMQLMETIPFAGKTVYDFGTGTGILAILAEKLGAAEVLAVDNDDWCIENATENLQNNQSQNIQIQKVVSAIQHRQFDIIIANVNRHIIEANMVELNKVANSNSTLILSGLLIDDQEDIVNLTKQYNWHLEKTKPLNGWVSLQFKRD